MISIIDNVKDEISLCGINHFIKKFGIPTVSDNADSKVHIVYGNKQVNKPKGFVIRIIEGEITEEIQGWLVSETLKVPLFGIPERIPKGNVIATFEKNDKSQPCVAHSGNEITIGFDLFRETGYILSGHMEKIWKGLSDEESVEISRLPIMDCHEKILFDSIVLAFNKMGIPLVRKDFWPDGKKFAVCLTHDVDEIKKTYQYLTRPLRLLGKGDFKAIRGQAASIRHRISGKEPYWTFDDLIETERRLNVRSTFFFLKESSDVIALKPRTWKHHGRRYHFKQDDVARMIRKLNSGGWEIGLHGSFDSYNDYKRLKAENQELSSVLHEKIAGTRQHNLNLEIPDTWIYHEKIGLEYDTSLGLKNQIGFRWGTSFPFHPVNPDDSKFLGLLEIPLSVMDINLFSSNSSWDDLVLIQGEVEKYSGVLTLLWHHTVFNDNEYPNWGRTYDKIVRYCKKRKAWLATGKEISSWWKKRESCGISYDFDFKKNMIRIRAASKGREYFLRIHFQFKGNHKISLNGCKIIDKSKDFVIVKSKGDCEISIGE